MNNDFNFFIYVGRVLKWVIQGGGSLLTYKFIFTLNFKLILAITCFTSSQVMIKTIVWKKVLLDLSML